MIGVSLSPPAGAIPVTDNTSAEPSSFSAADAGMTVKTAVIMITVNRSAVHFFNIDISSLKK